MENNMDIINNPSIILLTVKQVSQILQIGLSSTYELVNSEDCPFLVHRFGNTIRVNKSSLLQSLENPIRVELA